VDKNPFISKLNKSLPDAVLETRRFGRSGTSSIWVEAQAIQKVAAFLKNDAEFKLDWLENLSVVEFEKVLVTTYFVCSNTTKHSLVVRASAVPESPNAEVSFPSIRAIWPMGEPMELEAEELFGIHFRTGLSVAEELRFSYRIFWHHPCSSV
jgi:Ni,Fe-hydrogenase III component G